MVPGVGCSGAGRSQEKFAAGLYSSEYRVPWQQNVKAQFAEQEAAMVTVCARVLAIND